MIINYNPDEFISDPYSEVPRTRWENTCIENCESWIQKLKYFWTCSNNKWLKKSIFS